MLAQELDESCAAVALARRDLDHARRRVAAVAEVEAAAERVASAAVSAERSAARAAAVRVSWRDGLAGRLATLLAAGEPCPTGGALDHPLPAPLAPDAAVDAALGAAVAAAERTAVTLAERQAGQARAEGELLRACHCRGSGRDRA